MQIDNKDDLESVFKGLSNFTMDTRIQNHKIKALDYAQVVGFNINLPFSMPGDKYDIDVDTLYNILSAMGDGNVDIVESEDGGKLLVSDGSSEATIRKNTFDQSSMGVDPSNIDTGDYNARFSILYKKIYDAAKSIDKISNANTVILEADKNTLVVRDDSKTTSFKKEIELDKDVHPAKARYSMEFIKKIKDAVGDVRQIAFDDDHPIVIDSSHGDIDVRCFVAPRV